ncbi:hypothetical protein HaLaN_27997 [Haematococcus lacustris]|uniref:Uncharacterized protein n=1 Tax=Haematococcus lacustris TaxID=44745 RepID=A0A6A0A9U1_HAELA|nr:hypothetical protein HaLaN_27997 [Haematococcus lacustris]
MVSSQHAGLCKGVHFLPLVKTHLVALSSVSLLNDGASTPPAPMIGSRSEPGGLKWYCTRCSMRGGLRSLVPLLSTRTIEQLRLDKQAKKGPFFGRT